MSNFFIAVGGTGQMVAMAYWRIRKLMPWVNHGDTNLYHMDKDVIEKYQVNVDYQSEPINPLHNDVTNERFGQYFIDAREPELCSDILDSLFTSKEQRTEIAQGMFARPPVGASVLMDMFNDPGQEMEDLVNRLQNGNAHTLVICGSGIGGTGAGGVPSLAQYIDKKLTAEFRENVKIYLFYFLKHFHLAQPINENDDQMIINAIINSNAESGICYLEDKIAKGTDGCLIFGFDQTSERDYQVVGEQTENSQPLYLIASLYVQNAFFRAENIFNHAGGIYAHAVKDFEDNILEGLSIEKNGVSLILDQQGMTTMELQDLIRLNMASIEVLDRIKNLIHLLPHGIFYRGIPHKLDSVIQTLTNENISQADAAEELANQLESQKNEIEELLEWYDENKSEQQGLSLPKTENLAGKIIKMLSSSIGFIKKVDKNLNIDALDYDHLSEFIYSEICSSVKETFFSDE